jgi:hypothetical protein
MKPVLLYFNSEEYKEPASEEKLNHMKLVLLALNSKDRERASLEKLNQVKLVLPD